MTTYDDDYVQLQARRPDLPPVQVITLPQLGLHWPPPDKLFWDGTVWERKSYSQITDSERAGMTHVARGSLYEPLEVDPDRPCPHENYHATVNVFRLTEVEGGPVTAYKANISVRCAGCGEQFRWIGVEHGDLADRPTTGVDEFELRAPCRPASSDDDFGMGLPGFTLRMRGPDDPEPPDVGERNYGL